MIHIFFSENVHCLLACLFVFFFAVEYSRSVMAIVHSALFSLVGIMENRVLWLENRALWFYMQCSIAFRLTVFPLMVWLPYYKMSSHEESVILMQVLCNFFPSCFNPLYILICTDKNSYL